MEIDEETKPTVEDPEGPEAQARRSGKMIELAHDIFAYTVHVKDATQTAQLAPLKAKIIAQIEAENMTNVYERTCEQLQWPTDSNVLSKLRASNVAELQKLDEGVATAKEKFGEVEVAEALSKKAAFFSRIGDKDAAMKTYAEIPDKALSTGQKIDIAMSLCRLGYILNDVPMFGSQLEKAKVLNEKGGDWDRRNRLKVYEGAYKIFQRDFSGAAELLLDSVSTFTAIELYSYTAFIRYTVLACTLALAKDRPRLKKKVVDSPDVLSVTVEQPVLGELLAALYEGRYAAFLQSLTTLYPGIASDRLLAAHAPYYLREMRLTAYVQFLDSYKSVTLAGMARAFGVSPAFLDKELSRFIASGRVSAKIDAVTGVIETTRADNKNAQYHAVVKQGDVLLNKVQQLSRMVAV